MDWIAIRNEYESTDISLNDLAIKYELKINTVKSRCKRGKWKKNAPKKVAPKKRLAGAKNGCKTNKKGATNNKVTDIEASPTLTEMQRLFALYFVKNRNATMSAIKAGYAKSSAHVEGSRLIRNVKVIAEINRLRGSLVRELFLDAKDVLEIYVKIALADPTDYFEFGTYKQYVYLEGQRLLDPSGDYRTEDINFVRIKNSDEVDGSLIQEIRQTKDGISIKFHDKGKALDALKDYFDLTPDQHKRKIEEANLKLGERKVDVTEAELELRKLDSERKNF